jgi:hypothetical protein
MENSNSPSGAMSGAHVEGGHSALRGLWIDEPLRGRGLSRGVIAIWLRLCLIARVTPRTWRTGTNRAPRSATPPPVPSLVRSAHRAGLEGGRQPHVSSCRGP